MSSLDRREIELLAEKFSGKELEAAIKEVENGTPLAYALGEWYFYGLTFKLNRECLIPRPDTEHIVEKAIELVAKNGTFADLCTGSGCIAISLKKHRPDLSGYALDVSKGALEKAKENARRAGVDTHIKFFNADARDIKKPEGVRGTVACNPPYGERLMTPREVEALYRSIGKTFEALSPWQIYVLTSAENFESLYGRRADKVRKLYNGMIPCRLYQYFKPQNMKAGAAQLANSGKKCVGKQKNRNF